MGIDEYRPSFKLPLDKAGDVAVKGKYENVPLIELKK
jgi:hypothetical protein